MYVLSWQWLLVDNIKRASFSSANPSAPEGPLDVSVTDKACKLTWKVPKADGNSAILGYYVEKFDETIKKWSFVARSPECSYTIGECLWFVTFLCLHGTAIRKSAEKKSCRNE